MLNYSTMKEDVNRQLKFIETSTIAANETDTVQVLVTSPVLMFENLLPEFLSYQFLGMGVEFES